jgi:hypothetical protein
VQRAIRTANVRTIQETLSFLNKLEAIESGETGSQTKDCRPTINITKTRTLGTITAVLIVIDGMSTIFGTLVTEETQISIEKGHIIGSVKIITDCRLTEGTLEHSNFRFRKGSAREKA